MTTEKDKAPQPVKINKVDTRLARTGYGWTAFFMSLPFVGSGAFFTLGSFLEWDVIRQGANAPLWVIACVGLIFLLAGLMLFSFSVSGIYHQYLKQRFESQHGETQPWMYDYSWGEFSVSDEALRRVSRDTLGSLLVSIFLVPFIWWAFLSGDGPLPLQIMIGLTLLIWLWVVSLVIRRLAQYVKFGHATLQFKQFPFLPGEEVTVGFDNAVLGVGTREITIEARLRYVEEKFVSRSRGGEKSVQHQCFELYAQKHQVKGKPETYQTLSMVLPDEKNWVNQLMASPDIRYWELVLESELPGVDYRTTFVLPVYDAAPEQIRHNDNFARHYKSTAAATPLAALLRLVGMPLALLVALWLYDPDLLQQEWPVAADESTGNEVEQQQEQLKRSEDSVEESVVEPEVEARVEKSTDTVAELKRSLDGLIATTQFEVFEAYRTEAMDLHKTDTQLIGLTKSHVVSFRPQEVLLAPSQYRRLFDHRFNALSSVYAEGATVWIGSWYGELFRYRSGQWQELISRDELRLGKIVGIARHQGQLMLAGQGMVKWNDDQSVGERVAGSEGLRITAILLHSGQLYVAADTSLYRLEATSLRQVADLPAKVQHLAPSAQGLLVSTSAGLYRINGNDSRRLFDGAGGVVTVSLEDQSGGLLVGVRDVGLYGSADGVRWQKLFGPPGDHPLELVLDNNTLWIAFYDKGLVRGPYKSLTSQFIQPSSQ